MEHRPLEINADDGGSPEGGESTISRFHNLSWTECLLVFSPPRERLEHQGRHGCDRAIDPDYAASWTATNGEDIV
jgi:hypothetical protein